MEEPAAELPLGAPSPESRVLVHALRFGLRPVIRRVHGIGLPIGVLRAAIDGGSRLLHLDRRVQVTPVTDPAGEWVRTADSADDGALLYLHGGAYVLCSPRTHRALTAQLTLDTGLPVLVPEYRLAPEHPFPAALDDALAAYRRLLAGGTPAERIVVAGDSAGGHLAVTLAAELCRTGLPVPAGIVLFSPWADLTCELSTEWDRECRDPYILPDMGRRFARLYVGDGDFADPRLAVLSCTATGLPPFLIQAGGLDALRPDAERLAEVLSAAGAVCELQIWQGQMHVFQALHMLLPDARVAMLEAARFVRTATGARPASAAA